MKSQYIIIIFKIVFILIIISGCAARTVIFTASNTGIPVLLSSSDRINSKSDQKCNAENIPENRKINIKLANFDTMSFVGTKTSRSFRSDASIVDLMIIKKTLNDMNINVCIDKLETQDFGLYLLFGLIEKTTVSMDAHIEKVEKENNLNQGKTEE